MIGFMGGPGSKLDMAVSQWPATDRALWIAAFSNDSLFDQPPRAANMALTTKRAVETCYARWLVFLQTHYPAILAEPPEARASEPRVVEYLHKMQLELTSRAVLNYGCRLRAALEVIAPQVNWSWFTPIIDRADLIAQRQPRKPKPFEETDDLFKHGVQMMDAALADEQSDPVTRAKRFRNGLAFALLAMRPLRRANFIELTLDEHIITTHDGYQVTLEKTKTGAYLEFPFPERLVSYMDNYLAEHRHVLALAKDGGPPVTTSRLWLSTGGTPWSSDAFADMIARESSMRFGKRMTPHHFRHAAATTIMLHNPEQYQMIRIILGHSSSQTAERHYIHAKGTEASRAYHAVLHTRRLDAHAQQKGVSHGSRG